MQSKLMALVFAVAMALSTPSVAQEGDSAVAAALIKEKMLSWFRDGPDGTILSYEYSPVPMMGHDWWTRTAWQYRGFSSDLQVLPIMEVDRLNQISWRGRLTLSAAAVRIFVESGSGISDSRRRPCWQDWQAGPADKRAWAIEKRNGAWKISTETGRERLINQLFGPGNTPLGDEEMAKLLANPNCS